MKNKKKIALGAGALAVVLVAAGTFAWFTTTDKVKNVFGMDNFDVTITEDFDKPDVPLVPGTDVTKQVGVTNSGNVPVVVRVKLEETLALLEQDTTDGVDKLKVEYIDKGSAAVAHVPVLISQNMIETYKTADYKEVINTNDANASQEYIENVILPSDVTVLRKRTTTGSNTVYSYLAYVAAESTQDSGNHHLVQVTPVIGKSSAEKPESFEVKYAYNMKKPTEPDGSEYSVTATHGLNDDLLDKYYGSDFHDITKGAVVLNFADKVQIDGGALGDSNTTVWYLADDGYFYYTKALNGTSISEPLLKSVSIKKKAGNALKGATYTITPVMEAVQMDWDAAKATWTKMPGDANNVSSEAVVGKNAAAQLVYNIIKTGKGYYAGT